MKHQADKHSTMLKQWLAKRPTANRRKLRTLAGNRLAKNQGITHLLHGGGELASLRKELKGALRLN
jgi:hypothetical protein